MNQSQEPRGRPAVVTRDYVLAMLSRIFGHSFPAHLISPWLDYLEAKGVVTRDGIAYELPGQPGALAAFPEDAKRSLHNAIVSHARSAACPSLLKHAIPAPPTGGSGGSSQSGPRGIVARKSSLTTSRPDSTKAIERICWDREQHLKELAGFGAQAPDLFDWILKGLRETSSLARDRAEEQRVQEEERVRRFRDRQEARRKRIDEAINNANVPMLAEYWHAAVENLCAPTGNPMDHDLHVLWRTSHELSIAAEVLARPRQNLVAIRATTIGLPGDVNLARNYFASDPELVRLRTDATIEIGEILVAWELRERGGKTKPEVTHGPIAMAPATIQAASASGRPTAVPQMANIAPVKDAPEALLSPPHPTADTKQMMGWHEILEALGRDPGSRRDKDSVRRLNNETDGPIKRIGQRSVIANHGELLAWWKTAASRAGELAHARNIADRNHSVIDRTLSNPGVRKDEGFHAKERPNRRKGDGR